jgi:transposase
MKPIRIPPLHPRRLAALEEFYRTPKARLRTRAQMILLAAERGMSASEIAQIVRQSEETVRRWLKRYLAEGVEGLRDVPRPGAPRKVTQEYRRVLVEAVRRRPRSLGLPFSLWTLHRLADYMAERTGIRVEYETVRVHLKAAGIVLGRPQHTITSPDPEYALKKSDRRGPRGPSSWRPFLLRRRVQPELDAHHQGDVVPQGPTGDDPDPGPAKEALRHRRRGLPYRRYGALDPQAQAPPHEISNLRTFVVRKGARKPPSLCALQRHFHHAPFPDASRQFQG